jgi:hypothetical protein
MTTTSLILALVSFILASSRALRLRPSRLLSACRGLPLVVVLYVGASAVYLFIYWLSTEVAHENAHKDTG